MSQPPTAQRTWGGAYQEGPSALMLRFSESVSFDRRLAPFDIQGSRAHASMLAHTGLIEEADLRDILAGLEAIEKEIAEGRFEWDVALEDVHMNIEQSLLRRAPAAAKLHTGRSRNDQVATDMRLFIKQACADLDVLLRALLTAIVGQARRHRHWPIPGYTHLQRAQPVTVGHHLLAWAEMFDRDRARFREVADRANWCPLGSGALAGGTLPIDREFTARALGFVDRRGQPRITANSMDAVADRDAHLEFAAAAALLGIHFSRVAEDLVLWSSAEFGMVRLPENLTTGSSLMPQKKNPDSMELLRGKSGRLIGHLTNLLVLVKGLPLTYNRDLQEDKPPIFDSFDQVCVGLEILIAAVTGLVFDEARCLSMASDPLLLATDLLDYLVLKGVPFREAHHQVGALVAAAAREKKPLPELPLETARRVAPALQADWTEIFDLTRSLQQRRMPGSPGHRPMARALQAWQRRLKR